MKILKNKWIWFIIGLLIAGFSFFPKDEPPIAGASIPTKGDIIEQIGEENGRILWKELGNPVDEVAPADLVSEAGKKGMVILEETNRTPSSRIFKTDKIGENGQPVHVGRFYSGETFYKDKDNKWWEVNYSSSTPAEFQQKRKVPKPISFFKRALAATFLPTHDGNVNYFRNSSWATVHDAATGTGVITASADVQCAFTSLDAGEYGIARCGFTFDTSAIGAGTVTAATVTFNVSAVVDQDNDAQAYVNVYSFNPANETTYATADYDQFGTTDLSTDVDITGIGTGDEVFTLNATGLLEINGAGNTVLATREGHDVENSVITCAGSCDSGIQIFNSEQTGTDDDPILDVTYTPAAVAGGDSSEGILLQNW